VGELADFVRETGFDHLGVFTYSHEEGTRAHQLSDDVPARMKTARRQRIMTLQETLVARRHRARVGTTVRVLVDGPSDESPLVATGRLESQAPDIDSVVVLTDCDASTLPAGTFVEARVTGARGYDLVAAPLPA
jgi:ribosomal protein S12 methylthiotransferase